MAFFALFEIGSLVCAVSTSSKMLIVGRAIAGMGSSGIMNGAFTIIAGCVAMAKRPSMFLRYLWEALMANKCDSPNRICWWW